jgi:putative ATP-binding cassette transporter
MLKLKTKNIFYLLLYALPNTLLSFGIIYIINNVLSGKMDVMNSYFGIVFFSMIVYTYLLNIVFQKRLNKFSFDLLYENEKKVFSQILKAPLIKLEKFGSQRFFTAVEDLRTFSLLPYTVTHTVNSVLMLILCLAYMFTISFISAFIVICLIIVVAGSYFFVMNSMSKQVDKLRSYNEDYYKYVDDVMNGFKELKMNFFRREKLMNDFLNPNRDQAKELDFKINYIFLSINLISQYGLYMLIGVILFVLPAIGLLNHEEMISYVVILLFISGPINNLINLQQMYTRFVVANKRIVKFLEDFKITANDTAAPSKEMTGTTFEKLEFKDVVYNYKNESEDYSFTLGPINLEINQGETIFIVGGNGSGKSTFINLLTHLYEPMDGEILLNGEIAIVNERSNLQDCISAVFTNNHIFSNNYDDFTIQGNKQYSQLLKLMKLDKIILNDNEESVRRNFSKGQSKRVSLIFSLLESKSILVLDEWAADQDPHFRKFFYEELIPKFKAEGKTIIAVTHDDAYFNQADRIIKFDTGKIVNDIQVKKEENLEENFWV